MILYDYKCFSCNKQWEARNTVKNRLKPQYQPCPNCAVKGEVKQIITKAPGIHSGGAFKKNDSGFKEVISKIKQHHPRHNLGHH